MATPIDNAGILNAYWSGSFSSYNGVADGTGITALVAAITAMKELISQAANNPTVRETVFADNSLFERALIDEPRNGMDAWLQSVRGTSGAQVAQVISADRDMRPPRQIMLDGIHDTGVGGFFSAGDPSGISTWISTPTQAGDAIAGTISGDANPGARAAALQIVRDLAMPAEVITSLASSNAFASLDDQLSRSGWNIATRVVLQTLSAAAKGRIQADAAKALMAGLPTFPGANGAQVPTVPGHKPWYLNGPLLATGALGLIGGGAFAAHHRRTR